MGQLRDHIPLCDSWVEASHSPVVLVSWALEEGQGMGWLSLLLAPHGCSPTSLHEGKTLSALRLMSSEYLTALWPCLLSILWGFCCTATEALGRWPESPPFPFLPLSWSTSLSIWMTHSAPYPLSNLVSSVPTFFTLFHFRGLFSLPPQGQREQERFGDQKEGPYGYSMECRAHSARWGPRVRQNPII